MEEPTEDIGAPQEETLKEACEHLSKLQQQLKEALIEVEEKQEAKAATARILEAKTLELEEIKRATEENIAVAKALEIELEDGLRYEKEVTRLRDQMKRERITNETEVLLLMQEHENINTEMKDRISAITMENARGEREIQEHDKELEERRLKLAAGEREVEELEEHGRMVRQQIRGGRSKLQVGPSLI